MTGDNVCRRCGRRFPKRPGRGRQPYWCPDCRPLAETEQRRRRFLQRFHVWDQHRKQCVTCGTFTVEHGEIQGVAL